MARKPAPRRGATPARNTTPQPANNQWFFLFLGLAIGLSIGGVAYLSKTQTEPVTVAAAEPAAQEKKSTPAKTAETEPHFDFYAVLPEMEVVVPKEEMPRSRRQTTTRPQQEKTIVKAEQPRKTEPTPSKSEPAATTDGARYLLQAGSFRNNADADRRRAELVLKGFQANIQPVELETGATWHRVMIGPYNNVQNMADAQEQLSNAGIDTLAIRARQ
ncbi:MAG TPA: SPOR domain-containing protein [Alcanivoracaceae bacterium]|nr:SPOR domain-containing protein [Alcanivoracaceae bacterium]